MNHKDLNKTNNYYKNLEWTTRSGNQKHQFYLYHPNYKPNKCRCCGKELKSRQSIYCNACEKQRRRENWKPKEYFEEKIKYYSLVQIGKELGVTDNTVRKILRYYSLPFERKDIINYRKSVGTYNPTKRELQTPLSEKYVWYEIDGERCTATGWAKHLGLDHKRFSRYAQKHTYDEVMEYIKSFM